MFFEQFLNASGLFNSLVARAPLEYSSPNAPDKRSVLGTFLISILSGHTRYAHIEAIRHDKVSGDILGLKKLVSEDSARAAIARLDKQRSAQWLSESFLESVEPLLDVDWVLDVDTTLKTLYGKQEGSCLGYNPSKPGRPSLAYHTYWIASLVSGQDRWKQDVDGWEFASSILQLSGWTQTRRVVVYRRLHVKKMRQVKDSKQLVLCQQPCEESEPIALLSEEGITYEFAIYATNSALDSAVVGSTYRSRGDNENCYDELKNQWGWGGYSTQELKNTQSMACLVALVYNWWRVFIGLVEPGSSTREAKTSRPMFLQSVAVATTHRSQQHLCISWMHAQCEKITQRFTQASRVLNQLLSTAEQLAGASLYQQILNTIFPQLSQQTLMIEEATKPG